VSRIKAAGLALALGFTAASVAEAGQTLDQIKARGVLKCGVSTGAPGLSFPDKQGNWLGFDVDFCRGIAAAVFGDRNMVDFVPLSTQTRFTGLQSGEVDVLYHNTTWTLQRETALGLNFAGVNYYDGQRVMVPAKLGVKSVKELSGAAICVPPGSTTEQNLADYFRVNNLTLKPVNIDGLDQIQAAFFGGRCDGYTTDGSQLAGTRATKADKPDDYVILPEVISKEPLGPAVRHGDEEWLQIVRWTLYATMEAEERGITSKNVDDMLQSKDPAVQRLLGVTPGNGKNLGLDERWAYNEIKQVGNYAEIFARNLGRDSPMKLDRGINALWTQGGLIYGMPLR
jgi:general L-amino acid transport system substrate-binding protein